VQVGTADSNLLPANSNSWMRLVAMQGDTDTPADEADVRIDAVVNDVYRKVASPPDYAGELELRLPLRITDQANGSSPHVHGTVSDFTLGVTIPCVATPTPTPGGSCSVATSAEAVIPGMVTEGMRAIWQLDQVLVTDGGADDLAASQPNAPFMRQGVFAP
jgi:hypothetical protein